MRPIAPCFGECACSCGEPTKAFDEIAAREMRVQLRLDVLVRENIAWYCDRSLDDVLVGLWGLGRRSGLYLLWHKNDYCSVHELFHMKALYVGKGRFSARMRRHWEKQPTEEQQLIYFTFAELPNRIAKYAEQLILDLYDLPLNRSEKRGRATLCAHFSQSEVD